MLANLLLLLPILIPIFTICATALVALAVIPASKRREAQSAARRNVHQIASEYKAMITSGSPDIWFLTHPATGFAVARKMASHEWCVDFVSRIMKESTCLSSEEQNMINDCTARLVGQPAFMSALQKVDLSLIPVTDYQNSGELMPLFQINTTVGSVSVHNPEKAIRLLNALAKVTPRRARRYFKNTSLRTVIAKVTKSLLKNVRASSKGVWNKLSIKRQIQG